MFSLKLVFSVCAIFGLTICINYNFFSGGEQSAERGPPTESSGSSSEAAKLVVTLLNTMTYAFGRARYVDLMLTGFQGFNYPCIKYLVGP